MLIWPYSYVCKLLSFRLSQMWDDIIGASRKKLISTAIINKTVVDQPCSSEFSLEGSVIAGMAIICECCSVHHPANYRYGHCTGSWFISLSEFISLMIASYLCPFKFSFNWCLTVSLLGFLYKCNQRSLPLSLNFCASLICTVRPRQINFLFNRTPRE